MAKTLEKIAKKASSHLKDDIKGYKEQIKHLKKEMREDKKLIKALQKAKGK